MSNLYGLITADKKQMELIKELCFSTCGKISLGGFVATDIGPLMICCEVECPFVDKQTEDPCGESEMTGEPIYVRTFKQHNLSEDELDLQVKMFHERFINS